MAEHPIQGIMNVTMDKIHEMVEKLGIDPQKHPLSHRS